MYKLTLAYEIFHCFVFFLEVPMVRKPTSMSLQSQNRNKGVIIINPKTRALNQGGTIIKINKLIIKTDLFLECHCMHYLS